jgi:hypothetical protein
VSPETNAISSAVKKFTIKNSVKDSVVSGTTAKKLDMNDPAVEKSDVNNSAVMKSAESN